MKTGKQYKAPKVSLIDLDNSISLVMMTAMPPNPPPRPRGSGGRDDSPFASPFQEKPFD